MLVEPRIRRSISIIDNIDQLMRPCSVQDPFACVNARVSRHRLRDALQLLINSEALATAPPDLLPGDVQRLMIGGWARLG
jgi:hypothetical protein